MEEKSDLEILKEELKAAFPELKDELEEIVEKVVLPVMNFLERVLSKKGGIVGKLTLMFFPSLRKLVDKLVDKIDPSK